MTKQANGADLTGGSVGEAPHGAVIADCFADAVESGELDLPLPGGGQTRARWEALATIAERDLSLGRLAEGHADAAAILAELGAPAPQPGSRWGVWAARPPGPPLTASMNGGWRLDGFKQYCSGARSCTHALVTADAPDGDRLFAVSTTRLEPVGGTWPATGMAASDTLNVRFADIPAEPVGAPGKYRDRPGFAHGGAGVAACWYGGARGIGRALLAAAAERDVGPHALAHLGAVHVGLTAARQALDQAAEEIDADPLDQRGGARERTRRVRALIEEVATSVMRRVGKALGAGPLSHEEAHSRRVADLTVYLRQHRAERELAELGDVVAGRGARW